jgi:alpha-1,3-rhamnosyl/mannosyltransferase
MAGVSLGRDSHFFPSPERLAREAGLAEDAVRLLGWVDESDKAALYAGAAAFLFPSRYEGFGLPPLEAMACGTPVICSNASSLPEVCGNAARLVDSDDLAAWVDAIRAVIGDESLRSAMRARGLEQARRFSWTRAAGETLQVYRLVMDKQRRATASARST